MTRSAWQRTALLFIIGTFLFSGCEVEPTYHVNVQNGTTTHVIAVWIPYVTITLPATFVLEPGDIQSAEVHTNPVLLRAEDASDPEVMWDFNYFMETDNEVVKLVDVSEYRLQRFRVSPAQNRKE